MEKPLVGFLLAFMAGTMDAWTLGNAQTFATVQSGNVVASGYWLVQGDWPRFGFAFCSILAFGLGSLTCGILIGFAAGGATGFLVDAVTDGGALFLPAAMALVFGFLALADRGRRIDPTSGGLIG
jgi:uncharacterized membrane protein YoaK (UPF0700 family)